MQQHATTEIMTLIDIHWHMKVVYEEECVDMNTVWCWVAHVHVGKSEQFSRNMSDKQWSRRPWPATIKVHWNCVDELINRYSLCCWVGTSRHYKHFTQVMSGNNCRSGLLKSVCLWSMVQMLTLNWNRNWWILANSFWCVMNVKMKLLYSIITGDKNWMYNFQSEKKSESEEIHHKGSPVLEKFKTTVLLAESCLEFSGTLKAWHIQNSCILEQLLSLSGVKHWESCKHDFKSLSSLWAASPSRWQCSAACKCLNNCQDLASCFHCLASP